VVEDEEDDDDCYEDQDDTDEEIEMHGLEEDEYIEEEAEMTLNEFYAATQVQKQLAEAQAHQ